MRSAAANASSLQAVEQQQIDISHLLTNLEQVGNEVPKTRLQHMRLYYKVNSRG